LQAARIATAWVVGVLFVGLFLGPGVLADRLAAWLPGTQAGPALFRFLTVGSLAGGLVVTAVAGVSLLGGRLYCAAWCPLGVLQDTLGFLLLRVRPLRRWRERRGVGVFPVGRRRWVRWGVLGLTAGTAALGSWLLFALLEPYGAFGRLAVHLGSPVSAAFCRGVSSLLERFDVFALSAPTAAPPAALATTVTGAFLVGLGALVAAGGRLYCTTVCPVGTCLGLLAQTAPLRVRVDAGACTGCGLCVRRCRSSCIEKGPGGARVDPAACVLCMDCLAACPTGAVRYGPAVSAPPVVPRASSARRELLAAGASVLVAAAARPLRGLSGEDPRARAVAGPVSPPGSGDRERFTSRCTACQLCVRACPTHVLQSATFEYGLGGLLQPRLSFRHGFCEYDCQRCTAVCPTGALLPLDLGEKQRTQLGVVRLYKDRCIVYCRGEECGACVEVCPTHAVYSHDVEGLLCPEIAPGSCIGCGACEFACPVGPKAIEVHASTVHGRAAPPHAVDTPARPMTTPPAGGTSSDSGFPF